jgi:PAS domain S-box-containing protein
MTLAVAVWAFGYALEIAGADLPTKLFYAKVQYFGIATVPVAWFVFALQFAQRGEWVVRRRLVLLLAIPTITLLLSSSNEMHRLIWSSTALDSSGPFLALQVDHGSWFWIHFAYSYLLLLLGTSLFVTAVLRMPRIYRRQALAVLVAALVPWIGNVVYFANLSPIPQLDLTPFTFTLTSVMFAWSIFGFRLLDLAPVAREAVLEAMRDGVLTLDTQDRVVDMNRAAIGMLRITATQVLGRPAGMILGAQFDLLAQNQSGAEAHAELTFGEGGARRDLELRMSTVQDRQARTRGRLIMMRDITQQKQSEQQLRLQANQIAMLNDITRAEHSRLHAMITSSRDGVILIGLDRRILVVNQSALQLMHLPGQPEEWANRPIDDALQLLQQYAPDVVSVIDTEMRRIQHGDEQAGEGEYEIQARVIRWLNLPVMTGSTPLGRLLVLHDVTQERMLERLRNDLTNTMVHDLRNPLTAIQGSLSMLQLMCDSDSEAQEMIQIAARGTKNMLSLVTAILDVSRLETGEIQLAYSSLALDQLVAEIVQLQAPLASAKQLRMLNNVATALPPIWADDKLVRRVFQNLVGNAIKFTPSGGSITTTAERRDGEQTQILITIRDTGPGIPQELHSRLFQKFVTGSLEGTGSGLGLAFCRLAIEAHGGQIWIESDPGMGATFKFTLPADPSYQIAALAAI